MAFPMVEGADAGPGVRGQWGKKGMEKGSGVEERRRKEDSFFLWDLFCWQTCFVNVNSAWVFG